MSERGLTSKNMHKNSKILSILSKMITILRKSWTREQNKLFEYISKLRKTQKTKEIEWLKWLERDRKTY